MSIAYNPVAKAWMKVVAFWYALVLIWWWFAIDLPFMPVLEASWRAVVQSVLVGLGAGVVGLALHVAIATSKRAVREERILGGSHLLGAKITMGEMPAHWMFPPVTSKQRALAMAVLSRCTWWQPLAATSPVHAEAVVSVLVLMQREPYLPASPYPGGHAGRTLIEHSLAVVDSMLSHAGRWVYEGQKDKKGKIKVQLLDSDEPHRFSKHDAPLLILAALAHDVGKLACYQPSGSRGSAATVPVREVLPNHDSQGAKLLRRLPEVMALPVSERNALILAVGYYHHPFGMPLSPWISDRMRSLTELLIFVDVQAGKAEGHVLMPGEQPTDAEADSDVQGTPAVSAVGLQAAARDMQTDFEIPAAERNVRLAPPEDAPIAFRAVWRALQERGAISGSFAAMRVASRVGDVLYLYDGKARLMAERYAEDLGVGEAVMRDMTGDRNGNASRFTAELAAYLDAKGWLRKSFKGRDYAPSRALFLIEETPPPDQKKRPSQTKPVPAMLVDLSAFPFAADAALDTRTLTIARPLWGEHQAKNKAAADAGDSDEAVTSFEPEPDSSVPPPNTVDSDDLPFDM